VPGQGGSGDFWQIRSDSQRPGPGPPICNSRLTMEISDDVGPQERRGIPQAGGDAESTKEQVVVKVFPV
jgi:hypothetical protein